MNPRTIGQPAPVTYANQVGGYATGLNQGARSTVGPVTPGGFVSGPSQQYYPAANPGVVNYQPAAQQYAPNQYQGQQGQPFQQGQPTQPGQNFQQGQPGQNFQQGQPGQPAQQAQAAAPVKPNSDAPPVPNPVYLLPTHPMARVLNGTLVVKPMMGKFDKNYDVMGKMDPYCICYVGTQSFQTQVAKGQGQECTWEDALHFPIKGEQFLIVDTLDYDVVGQHDFIGRTQIDLSNFLSQGHFQNWVEVFDNTKTKTGTVYLSIDMVAEGQPRHYQGPVTNVLQYAFGEWASLHPGYVPQPIEVSNVIPQQQAYGGQSQYGAPSTRFGSVPANYSSASHVPGTQIGGYQHVVGPQTHTSGYGYAGVSPHVNGGSTYGSSPSRF